MSVPSKSPIVPGRNCDGCALCCMVLSIQEINKPQGKWCDHCSTRRSCDIYETRPDECRKFHCGYLTIPELDESWKPSKSKIILVAELDGNRGAAHVHPSRPDAWKKEPFYSALKEWSVRAAPLMHQVVAYVSNRVTVILPDKDVYLGEITDDQRIVSAEIQTPFGSRIEAMALHKDDPRIAGMTPGKAVTITKTSKS